MGNKQMPFHVVFARQLEKARESGRFEPSLLDAVAYVGPDGKEAVIRALIGYGAAANRDRNDDVGAALAALDADLAIMIIEDCMRIYARPGDDGILDRIEALKSEVRTHLPGGDRPRGASSGYTDSWISSDGRYGVYDSD